VDERRAQLVALGLDLFSRRAYDDISIDAIAREAGISKGLLYHYFPTKRDFYIAAIREAARRLLERTRPDDALAPLDRLRAGLDAYLEYVDRHGPAYVALMRGGIGSDTDVARIVEDTRGECLKRLIEGLPVAPLSPAVRLTLKGWIGFVEASSLEWVERKEMERGALCDLLVEVLTGAVSAAVRRGGG
jgi:AcrR family transcriptional regulator